MKILVTGGAGFIGSELVRRIIDQTDHHVLNLDKLTYAANLKAIEEVKSSERYKFVQEDICNQAGVEKVINDYKPDAIMHLAAESHVDRSIENSSDFITTNINGTHALLEACRKYWNNGAYEVKFIHVSTDEVYGSLGQSDPAFSEETPYAPNSPYSASKAASDHLVRSYYQTYDLPAIITHCSNNYGPWQNAEKLIPCMIGKALSGEDLPIYGSGENIRDWIHVSDHVSGLLTVLDIGHMGEVYNMGGENEVQNLHLVHMICDYLDELKPREDNKSYKEQISFVKDRLGHDMRYAIDNKKIQRELNWSPQYSIEQGLLETIKWYIGE